MTYRGPFSAKEGETIENVIIYAEPNTDIALRIARDNVTLRNVIIYHPANGKGIFGWKSNNLVLENVEIVQYGNLWGANPCPTRSPLDGYRCMNIEIWRAEGVRITNVRVENGSKGINIIECPNAILDYVVAKNVRGPFPAGQCF